MNSFWNKQEVAGFSTFFLTLTCGLGWAEINAISLYVTWAIQLCYLAVAFSAYEANRFEAKDNSLLKIYFVWVFLSIVRGALFYTLGNYWIWKNWFNGSFDVLLPALIYLYARPEILSSILRTWLKYVPFLLICLLPFVPRGAYHFFLGPIYIVAFFWPLYSGKWKVIILLLMLLMLGADLTARSQVIKTAFVLFFSLLYLKRRFVSQALLKWMHWIFYILPLTLLFLGLTGRFNVLEDVFRGEGVVVTKIDRNGKAIKEDLSSDTRTFIYIEVISSAIKHNYVWEGRTPARGNDSAFFGTFNAEELNTGLYERHSNEVGLPSLFTWLGLIGLILISLIYLRSSYLALYHSNNIYIKILGCFVAFRWSYGWIEDTYGYTPMILGLYMVMAMCMSKTFRQMNDNEMKGWLLGLVGGKK